MMFASFFESGYAYIALAWDVALYLSAIGSDSKMEIIRICIERMKKWQKREGVLRPEYERIDIVRAKRNSGYLAIPIWISD